MVLAVVGFLPQSYNGFSCVCSTINIELQIVQKFLQAIEQKNTQSLWDKNFDKFAKTQVRSQKSISQAFDPQ